MEQIRGVATLTWVITALVALSPATSHAGTLRLERDGSGEFMILQDAVDAAASGDTILVGPGLYTEFVSFHSGLSEVQACAKIDPLKKLSLIGVGADLVVFDPDATYWEEISPVGIYHISSPGLPPEDSLFISGITIRNARTGIYSNNTLRIDSCRFETSWIAINAWRSDCVVARSEFVGGGTIVFRDIDLAMVEECQSDQRVIFRNVNNGIVRGCTFNYEGSSNVYTEDGSVLEVSNCIINGGESGVAASSSGTVVTLTGNRIQGQSGDVLLASDGAIFQGSGNDFIKGNSSEQKLIRSTSYSGVTPVHFNLKNNLWAQESTGTFTTADEVLVSMEYDGANIVIEFEPFLTESIPVRKSSLGSVKAMFR